MAGAAAVCMSDRLESCTFAAGVFHSRVARATLPSGEMFLVRIGFVTLATCGTFASCLIALSMACSLADDVTLCWPLAANTTCVWAPEKVGIFSLSRLTTFCDSVPGMVMLLFSVPLPTTLSVTTTTTTSSQPARTRRLWP